MRRPNWAAPWLTALLVACGSSSSRAVDASAADHPSVSDAAVDVTASVDAVGDVMPTDARVDVSADGTGDARADGEGADRGDVDAGLDASCPAGLTPCEEGDGGVRCVDLRSDTCNCGFCGAGCPFCNGGICQDCGGAPIVQCFRGGACVAGVNEPYCADLMVDHDNCGACFSACAPGQLCVGGSCWDPTDAGR